MIKVITYGTYDLLHYGHLRLLERAKALGDYLIVGITSDDFDKNRGKINGWQTLAERIEAVRATGLADEIIVEEYEGQKIDDIIRYKADIFAIGSDWLGKFEYLKEYCQVVYLPRTEGVSSSDIRKSNNKIKMGIVGEVGLLKKVAAECDCINGIELRGIYSENKAFAEDFGIKVFDTYEALLDDCDAVYLASHPSYHYCNIMTALKRKKHVLCESPIALNAEDCDALFKTAKENDCVLMDAVKTAYSTAYQRMKVLVKSGRIGKVISVDAVCTSLSHKPEREETGIVRSWNGMYGWAPVGLLPVFDILGTEYLQKTIVSHFDDEKENYDAFTKINFIYKNAVASVLAAVGAKSESCLVVSGTEGYVYVPSPWWKTDYFEIRYENTDNTRKFFYRLDGEGIRNELMMFAKSIGYYKGTGNITPIVSQSIAAVIDDFDHRKDFYKF